MFFFYTCFVYRKCKRPIHRCTLRRCWIQYFSLVKKLAGCSMWCNVDQKCVRCSWKTQKNKNEFKTRRQCRPSGNRYTNKIIIFRFIIFNLFHLSCYFMGHMIASHWLLLTQGGSIPVFFFCFVFWCPEGVLQSKINELARYVKPEAWVFSVTNVALFWPI